MVPRLVGRRKDGVTVAGSLRPVAWGGTGHTRLVAGRAARAQGRGITAEHPWVQPCVIPPPGQAGVRNAPGNPATPPAVTQATSGTSNPQRTPPQLRKGHRRQSQDSQNLEMELRSSRPWLRIRMFVFLEEKREGPCVRKELAGRKMDPAGCVEMKNMKTPNTGVK